MYNVKVSTINIFIYFSYSHYCPPPIYWLSLQGCTNICSVLFFPSSSTHAWSFSVKFPKTCLVYLHHAGIYESYLLSSSLVISLQIESHTSHSSDERRCN